MSSKTHYVDIPFYPRFREPMLKRVKRCTARTSKKGRPGDRFRKWGAIFEIVGVQLLSADEIARRYWREEGCSSEADFRSIWRKIHPRLGWHRLVHLHWFELQ